MNKDIEELRAKYVGKRIKCIYMNDPNPIPKNTIGTVKSVDDIGTLHVKWDNGRTLGIIAGEDIFILV